MLPVSALSGCADETAQAVGSLRERRFENLGSTAAEDCAGVAAQAVAVEERPLELFSFFEATAEDRAGGTAQVVASRSDAWFE
jgi:hypothetical protein